MQKVLDSLRSELASLRTGRANPALLEHIKANAYGTLMPLLQLATISAPDPQLLQVAPFDVSNAEAIAKAIQEANLGFHPAIDKNIIRVPIPPLTEERRQEYIKLAKQLLEQGRVRLRHIRQEAMSDLDGQLKAKTLSEDAKFAGEKEVQKVTDEFMEKTEQIGKAKEQELLTV